VIAEMTYAYDVGKVTREGFEGDHRQSPISETWLRAAQELTSDGLPSFGEAGQRDAEIWLLERLYNGGDPLKHPARPRYFTSVSWKETVQALQSRNLIRRTGRNLVLTDKGRDAVDESLVYDLDPPARLSGRLVENAITSGKIRPAAAPLAVCNSPHLISEPPPRFSPDLTYTNVMRH
jgi:hypothetical protein